MPLLLKKKVFSLALSSSQTEPRVGFLSAVFALFLYIGITSLAMIAFGRIFSSKLLSHTHFVAASLAQIATLIVCMLSLIGFSKIHSEGLQSRIWGKNKWLKPLLKGMCLSIVCYPVVMLLVESIQLVVDQFFDLARSDQLAVAQLKKLRSYPGLFWSFIICAVTVVPVLEELLFRGFFQNYFVDLFGPKAGILLASLVFSGFHYSSEQGATNIEMLVGLFILSYLIGVTYLKEKSLFVAIGMHAAFNALGVLFVIFIKEGTS